MSIHSESNISSLLELIPSSQLEPHEIAISEKGGALPTYKFSRTPQTFDELKPSNDGVLVSMENGTLVTICAWFDLSATTKFKKCLKLSYGVTTIKIFGDSDDAIVETAVFFGTLRIPEGSKPTRLSIEFKGPLNFDAARSEQLARLFEPTTPKKIIISLSKANKFLSAVLASRPYPIDLEFEVSSMDCDAFIEHLEGRTTPFGSLSLGSIDLKEPLQRRLFNHLHQFDHLQIDRLPRDLVVKLLAAPIHSIGFTVSEETGRMGLAKATIVPKAIKIATECYADPKRFVQSFLTRVAQLRHIESLSITLCEFELGPADIGKQLLRAVGANSNLTNLQFHANEYQWGKFMQKLFLVAEEHESLRTFQIQNYPNHLDPNYKWLKRLLTRNRYLEVSDILYDEIQHDNETFEIYELNRFFRGSKSLKNAPKAIRPALVGAVLTQEFTCNFQCATLLLTDHVDAFCELLHEVVPTGGAEEEDGDLPSVVATNAESGKGEKRKRE